MVKNLLLVDFDNTLYLNETVKQATQQLKDIKPTADNIRLQPLYTYTHKNITKIIFTGRPNDNEQQMIEFIDEHSNKTFELFYFMDWSIVPKDAIREIVYIHYWSYKWAIITELRNLHKKQIIVIEDDPAICGMCARFEIPNIFIDLYNKYYRIYRNGFYKKYHIDNLNPMFEYINFIVAD